MLSQTRRTFSWRKNEDIADEQMTSTTTTSLSSEELILKFKEAGLELSDEEGIQR